MKFIDLFAGIGGFRTGMEMNGHECVAFCEIDKYARQSYKAIHDTEGEEEWHDITQVTDGHIRQLIRDRGHIDCICGGFPCQSFSIAGKRGGFDDTRGTLFFEIMRIASIVRPRYLFLENVKGLFSHDGGATFETILNTLDEAGYDAEWSLLNSKDFGVPQNRERVFIIGHLRGAGGRTVFPVGGENQSIDIEYFGNTHPGGRGISGEVYNSNGLSPTLSASDYKDPKKFLIDDLQSESFGGIKIHKENAPTLRSERFGLKVVQPVLTPDRVEKRQNGRRFKEDGEPMFTLTSQDRHGVAILRPKRTKYGKQIRKDYEDGKIKESRHNMIELEPRDDNITNTITTVQKDNLLKHGFCIRKLTPLECFRLQGFTDEQFYKAKNDGVSDSQLYKQAGNSVTVNVIDAIARRL